MRQLIVQVPRGQGKEVLEIAKSLQGVSLAQLEAKGSEELIELVLIHVSNRQVEELFAKLEDLPDVNITLLPRGVITLHHPAKEAPQQALNIEERSSIEIFLSGLQPEYIVECSLRPTSSRCDCIL